MKHHQYTTSYRSLKNSFGSCLASLVIGSSCIHLMHGQELPPAADRPINFTSDILPILQESCFQCHGPKEAKGGFRMTSREDLLKEGDYGANVIPGNSAESTLVQFAAHLEEDSEMPPIGKGDKLSDEQIGLLRAWIDQGVTFEEISEESFYFKVTPQFRFIGVDGNKSAFREHYWMRDGVSGGLRDFEWKQTMDGGKSFSGSGRVTAPYDQYAIEAEIAQRDLGFFRFGFNQSRSYDDPYGGLSPILGLGPWALGRDLHSDFSNAWFELGLDRPDKPKFTLGYEYRQRQGSKSMLQWGPAFDAAFNSHNVYPAWKRLDQETHIITLDVEHNWNGFLIEDNFRGEFYSQKNVLHTGDFINAGDALPATISTQEDDYDHFQGSNALTIQKKLKPWWLASGGYYYSHLNGDANLSFGNFDPTNPAGAGAPFSSRGIELSSESHIMNLNSLLGPWKQWTAYGGVQTEWTRRKGTGPTTFFGVPSALGSNTDRFQIEENFGIRNTSLPNTIFYTDVRLQQESIGQSESGLLNDGFDARDDFMRNTDARGRHAQWDLGTTISPWDNWTIQPNYGYKKRQHDFKHLLDTDRSLESGNGYPAAIQDRETEGQDWGVKVGWKPVRWLKSSIAYVGEKADYQTDIGALTLFGTAFPAGSTLAGNFDSHTYRFTTTLTPAQRWYWTGSASYTDMRMVSSMVNNTTIAPYDGELFNLFTSWTFLYNETTTLQSSYTFNHANYGQSLPMGLPMGSEFDQHAWRFEVQKQLSDTDTLGVQYAYFRYRDDLAGGFLDYDAHGLFVTWSKIFQ